MEMIEHLSSYMAYSGRTYENHLATMEYWKTVDRKREKRVLFVPTGALLSKTSFNEGQSIPGIAHGVELISLK